MSGEALVPPEKNIDLDRDRLRARIQVEDSLLNSRTTIFLAINGLWIAVVGRSDDVYMRKGVATLGILISLMWLICSWQSLLLIRKLTREYCDRFDDELEEIVQAELSRPKWPRFKKARLLLRPTNILANYLPSLFVITWALLLIYLARP